MRSATSTHETLALGLCMPVWARLHWFARALAKLLFMCLCWAAYAGQCVAIASLRERRKAGVCVCSLLCSPPCLW